MEQPDYARQLLTQLDQQRSTGYLCDVVIAVESALFRAHKNILAASSGYFKSLVLHDNVINLDTDMVSPSVFRQVLDFIYSGHLSVSDQGVSALLTAASYLQLSHLTALCRQRLKPSAASSRTPDSRLSHAPLRVPRNRRFVSPKAEGSQTQEECLREDLSEEEVSLSSSVKIVQGADAGHDFGLDLSGRSLAASTITEEVRASRPQRASPQRSFTSLDNVISSFASAFCETGQMHRGEFQQRPKTTAPSEQQSAWKRPRFSRESSLDVTCNGQEKRQRAQGGDLMDEESKMSPEHGDQRKDRDGDEVLENGLHHSGSSGQSEEGEMSPNYVYRQPQPPPEGPLGDNLYVCIPCGKGFPSSEELIAHVDTHTAEQLYNKVKEEDDRDSLKKEDPHVACESRELQTVKEEEVNGDPATPQHICCVCSKSFLDQALLVQHEKSHWLIRPFPCNICGKLFTQRGTMTRHMRSHLGLKPFACEECGMRFTRQYRLTEHMRVHSGEKPYECKLCGGKFTQQRNLISHLKMHTSPS